MATKTGKCSYHILRSYAGAQPTVLALVLHVDFGDDVDDLFVLIGRREVPKRGLDEFQRAAIGATHQAVMSELDRLLDEEKQTSMDVLATLRRSFRGTIAFDRDARTCAITVSSTADDAEMEAEVMKHAASMFLRELQGEPADSAPPRRTAAPPRRRRPQLSIETFSVPCNA